MARRPQYPQGSVVIEEQGGLNAGESFLLVVFGVSVIGVAIAVAVAVIQLSLALSVAILSVGLGFGGSLGAKGLAEIILARGRAHALVLEARQRAKIEAVRAAVERERLALERERLQLEAERRRHLSDGGNRGAWSRETHEPMYRIIE